jgi:D-sedoheptulose 7-phosphate isomerase
MTDRPGPAAQVRAVLELAATMHRSAAAGNVEAIVRGAEVLSAALAQGHKVLVCGNGGSATDAQHFAAELVGRYQGERRAWPVMALAADVAVMTSVSNDYGFDAVFARQVEAWGQPGDVLVGITTSGTSANVNAALTRARAIGMATVGLTGRNGGDTAALSDVHINVPSSETPRVQEVQRTILHVLCELIERELR